jgi:predicted SnoaL-like aldol condensation-catalyzing enzyme
LSGAGRTKPQAAPTGKQVTIKTIDIWRVEGGKLAEHWDVIDIAGIRQQLAPPSATQK